MRATLILCISLFVFVGCGQNKQEVKGAATLPETGKSSFPLTGTSIVKDATGDVRDGDERKPKLPLPHIDLQEVSLELSGGYLVITYTNSGDIPTQLPEFESAIWTVTACSPDGEQCCIFSSNLIDKWNSGLQDMSDNYYHKMPPPEINQNKIIARYPVDKLPKFMSSPFKWRASSESGEDKSYSDQAPKRPENLHDAGGMVSFPQ